jgi:hypothetical protein
MNFESIRQEAFENELEKIALSPQIKKRYLNEVFKNAAKWKNISEEYDKEGLKTLANHAWTRATEAYGKIKGTGFGGKQINRLASQKRFSPESIGISHYFEKNNDPKHWETYKNLNDEKFKEVATAIASKLPPGKSMAPAFATRYMDSMRKIVNPKSTL